MKMPKPILLLTLIAGLVSLKAQTSDSINFERLDSKKLVRLLKSNGLYTAEDLQKVEVSCYSREDSAAYSSHTKDYIIKADIETVWEAYKMVSPTEPGNKKDMVSFGLLYGKRNNKIYYSQDAYDGLQEGQLVFWNLRMLSGLFHLPVGQTVTEVNDEEKYFEICYLSQGTSHGSQYIRLYPTEGNYTRVVHHSYFKSHSKFRDRRLYPGLHEKAINEFHEKIRQEVEKEVL